MTVRVAEVARLFAQAGVLVRTVAKYRETMRIPSSVQRRRDKALSGTFTLRTKVETC